MTVPAIEPVKNHWGDGSNKIFDFGFYIENENQLVVYKTVDNLDIKLINGVDYKINETGNIYGSYITFPLVNSQHGVLAENEILSIQLDVPISQESEYGVSSRLQLSALEYSFDYLTRICQILARKISRAVKVSEGSSLSADELLEAIFSARENSSINANAAKNAASQALNILDNANKLLDYIKNLIDKIENEQLDKSFFIASHILFERIELDKKLSGKELLGLGEQNKTYSYNDFPDAYLELADDFNNGEKKVFTDGEINNYVKYFNASKVGDFYIPYAKTLQIGTELFSNLELSQSLGVITDIVNVFVDSYIGSSFNFYLPLAQNLSDGIEVFSDEALTESLGFVSNLLTVSGRKYTAFKSGIFYTENVQLAKGLKIYSDETLTVDRGAITNIGKINSDKYSVSDIGNVYVPEDSIINVGSKLYSDVSCSQVVATVTQKGSQKGSVYYCYSATFPGTGQMYIYVKNPLNYSDWQDAYSDSACTKRYVWYSSGDNSAFNGKLFEVSLIETNILVFRAEGKTSFNLSNFAYPGSWNLVSNGSSGGENYICVDNNPEKLSFFKIGTDSTDVISINTEDNETYTIDEVYNKNFVKIGEKQLQSYIKDTSIEAVKIAIDDGPLQTVKDLGLKTTGKFVLEYILAKDNHKIVDSNYKNAIASLIEDKGASDFFVIDFINKTFTLPQENADKNIYLCLGNTLIKSASIDVLSDIYKRIDGIDKTLGNILGG